MKTEKEIKERINQFKGIRDEFEYHATGRHIRDREIKALEWVLKDD